MPASWALLALYARRALCGVAGQRRRGRAGRAAVRRAVRLHRHDLRVHPLPAGMGASADRGQLRGAGLRLRLHARHRLAAFAAPTLVETYAPGRDRADRRWACCRAARRWCATAASGTARACRRRSASIIRASCRSRRDLMGGSLQHARVLPRPQAQRAALGQVVLPRDRLRAAGAAAGRRVSALRPRACCAPPSCCSTAGCSPSAGSSSRRPTTRRTSTTRRSPESGVATCATRARPLD